jgi:hypothetical protein
VEKNVQSVFSPTTRELGAGALFVGADVVLMRLDVGGAHSMGAPITVGEVSCWIRA